MTTTTVTRSVQAPADRVFAAVAEPESLTEVIPDVVRVMFLTPQHTGRGTRFQETRLMRGKEAMTELEITEHEPPHRVRYVADSHGTVWDTVFAVTSSGEGTEVVLTMEARAHRLLPRLLNPLFKSLIRKGLEKHLDAVKAWCEA